MAAGSIGEQGGVGGDGFVDIQGERVVMQNRQSPEFRSVEVGISEMAEYWPHSFFTLLLT